MTFTICLVYGHMIYGHCLQISRWECQGKSGPGSAGAYEGNFPLHISPSKIHILGSVLLACMQGGMVVRSKTVECWSVFYTS